MTPMLATPSPVSPIASAIRGLRSVLTALWQTYRLGGRTWSAAPAILAIAILPEFAQHVAEVQLGMFDSTEAFRANADHSLRWFFAYPKVAGFLLAILMTARFWALGSVRRALLMPPLTLVRVILICAATFALAWPFEWAAEQGLPAAVNIPLQTIGVVIQAGTMLYFVGVLLGDPEVCLRRTFTALLPAALILALLALAAFAPAQALHLANHKLAMGQPAVIVWLLMIFDSLWVGLFAGLLGAALYVGYRTGLTWRGWSEHPARLGERHR